jgi:hypothetical protein
LPFPSSTSQKGRDSGAAQWAYFKHLKLPGGVIYREYIMLLFAFVKRADDGIGFNFYITVFNQ